MEAVDLDSVDGGGCGASTGSPPDGDAPAPGFRARRVVAWVLVVVLLAALTVSIGVDLDLRRQRDDLRARLALQKRVSDSLLASNHDLQRAGEATLVGDRIVLLPADGTVHAVVAVLFVNRPGSTEPRLWLLLDATEAEANVLYSLTAESCSTHNSVDLQGGLPAAGSLHLAVTDANLPLSGGPYAVVLHGREGRPVGGVRLEVDRQVTTLAADDPGC